MVLNIHRPQADGWIEASHKFLNNCIRKFTKNGEVEWDEVPNSAHVVYNFFPNSQIQESYFFLMMGRDAYNSTVAILLQPKLRYLGNTCTLLSLEMLRQANILVAVDLKG